MTVEQRNRVTAINELLKTKEQEVRSAKDAETIDRLGSEINQLIEERGQIMGAVREKTLNVLERDNVINVNLQEEVTFRNYSKKQLAGLALGKMARSKAFNDMELRAMQDSLTTTSSTFVQASETTAGINNGGLFIPTVLLFDFLLEVPRLSPIVQKINFTAISGLTKFIMRVQRAVAKTRKEGETTPTQNWEWKSLEGKSGFIQSIVRVTREVLALSDMDFGSYLMSQMRLDFQKDLAQHLIYGTGEDDLKGITIGATEVTFTMDDPLEGIRKGIESLGDDFVDGAEIYMSRVVYESSAFQKDSEGRPLIPIYNNTNGLNSILYYPVHADFNLKAGEFLIGNVRDYFKVNLLIPTEISEDIDVKKNVVDYVANTFATSVPHPNAFVHGKAPVTATAITGKTAKQDKDK